MERPGIWEVELRHIYDSNKGPLVLRIAAESRDHAVRCVARRDWRIMHVTPPDGGLPETVDVPAMGAADAPGDALGSGCGQDIGAAACRARAHAGAGCRFHDSGAGGH